MVVHKRFGSRWGWTVLLATSFSLAACGDDPPKGTEWTVVDPTHQLAEPTLATLREISLEEHHALVVAIVKWDDDRPIGPQADKVVEDLAKKCDSSALCRQQGIFVLVDPASFPVLRVGSNLRMRSMWGGATYGPDYVEAQTTALALSLDERVVTFADRSVTAVVDAERDSNWFEKAGSLSETLGYDNFAADVAATSYHGDGFFDHWLVRPVLGMQTFERHHVGTWWISVLLSSGLLFGLGMVVRWISRRFRQLWLRWLGPAVAVVFELMASFIAVPFSAAMVLQRGARLEDAYDMRAAVGDVPNLDFFAEAWGPARSWWLVLVVAVVALPRGIARTYCALGPLFGWAQEKVDRLEAKEAVGFWHIEIWKAMAGDAEASPGRQLSRAFVVPLVVAAASYAVLPSALVIVLLMAWLVDLPRQLVGALQTNRTSNSLTAFTDDAPYQETPLSKRVRLGAVVAGVGLAALVGILASGGGANAATTPLPTATTQAIDATTTSVPFQPEAGVWGAWPFVAKPQLQLGSVGDEVRYLQGVLFLKAGQQLVTISGTFDEATSDAVMALQSFLTLPVTGVVDASTWVVIDQLAQG